MHASFERGDGKVEEIETVNKFEEVFIYANELVSLGYTISKRVLKMDLEKVKPIIEWKTPMSIKLRRFHCLVNFYRKFIRNSIGICALLTNSSNRDIYLDNGGSREF